MSEKRLAAHLATLVFFALTAGDGHAAEPIRLVMPTVYGTHVPGLGAPAVGLAKRIKQLAHDTIELEVKEPGDGVQPQALLEAVSSGKVDGGFATASFWTAKLPAAALFAGFPFGPDADLYLDWFDNGNGRKLYQEMYDQAGLKVHVMPCGFGGSEASGWFAKEIREPKDIKGLRVRMFGLGGRVMGALGAKTVILPGSTLGTAFDKHDIDAAELLTPAADARLDLKNHVKLIYVPGWHQPETVLELLINKERWNALDHDQQDAIEQACRATLLATKDDSAELQKDALAELAQNGVRVETWPEEVLNAFRAAWEEVAKDEGDRDILFRVVLTDLEDFKSGKAGTPQAAQPATPP